MKEERQQNSQEPSIGDVVWDLGTIILLIGMLILTIWIQDEVTVDTTQEETQVQTIEESTMKYEEETVELEETNKKETRITCALPIKEEPEIDSHDLELLARLINAEAGADWCSDRLMLYVGSVVLNRVNSDRYPDTIEEVIYQEGQYACVWDGNFEKEPCERAWRIAKKLLEQGSALPDDVIYQAEFTQGTGIHAKVQNMYFCFE